MASRLRPAGAATVGKPARRSGRAGEARHTHTTTQRTRHGQQQQQRTRYRGGHHDAPTKGANLRVRDLERCLYDLKGSPSGSLHVSSEEFFESCVTHGRIDMALKYITLTKGRTETSPAIVSYRNLIACCTNADDFKSARLVYDKLVERNFSPNEYLYSRLIAAAGRAGDTEAASFFFERAVEGKVANLVVVNATMDAFGRSNKAMDVLRVYRRMEALGLEENATTYNILMQTADRLGRPMLVTLFYNKMKRRGVAPSERTFAILLASRSRLAPGAASIGLADWAFATLDDMSESHNAQGKPLKLNDPILGALFSVCACEGRGVRRAKALLEGCLDAGMKPNANVWCAFFSLCGAAKQAAVAVQACEAHCARPLSPYVRSALCSAVASGGPRSLELSKRVLTWHNEAHKAWLMRIFMEEDGPEYPIAKAAAGAGAGAGAGGGGGGGGGRLGRLRWMRRWRAMPPYTCAPSSASCRAPSAPTSTCGVATSARIAARSTRSSLHATRAARPGEPSRFMSRCRPLGSNRMKSPMACFSTRTPMRTRRKGAGPIKPCACSSA